MYLVGNQRKIFWLNGDAQKQFHSMNRMVTQITKRNAASENITYLVDYTLFMCQHKKLHPLKSRRGKLILETMNGDIETIIQHDSHKYITSEERDVLSTKKWTNCDIEYDLYCCSDCTK